MQVVPHGTKTEHKHIKTAVQPRKLVIMKKNDLTVLHGSEMEISLQRIGTRCKICGEPIDPEARFSWVHTSVPACPSVYVHKECIRERRYHEEFISPSGESRSLMNDKRKTTRDEIIITPEIEAAEFFGDWNNLETRAAFLVQFQLYPEHDGSVWKEFHPYAEPNLHGNKKRYRELEKWIDMKDSTCGHHLNGSWYNMTAEDSEKIRNHARELFGAVQSTMRVNEEATEKVFGRYFTHYAEDNSYFDKWNYSWLNLGKSGIIELRLAHYESPEQITWLMFMFKEWLKTLRKYCNGEISVERASKQIKNEFVKVATGKATYQRAEQNSKI